VSTSGRALSILGRFPRHLALQDEGKLFGAVVTALAQPLDVQASQLGRVRRAHRLGHADEHLDLLRLASLHRLQAAELEPLALRRAAVAAARDVLAGDRAGDPDEVIAAMPGLLGIPADTFDSPDSWAEALAALLDYPTLVRLLRARATTIIGAHRAGNGTVSVLLRAAANVLDLDLLGVRHLTDPVWHEGRCRDRLRLRPSPDDPGDILPADDLLYLEENPLRQTDLHPVERRHGDRFLVRRVGFDAVATAVRLIGVEDRTVLPMVVQRDAGFGLAFTGRIPDGQELRFDVDGTVTLAGADVSTFAYAFRGAVYTDTPATAASPHAGDFLFVAEGTPPGPRDARFVTSEPVTDTFDPGFVWPRAPGPLGAPALAVGETRWAFFVRVAHFGTTPDGATPVAAIPFPLAGVFEASVWAAESPPDQPAAKLGFSWEEREAFSLKVWLPRRFGTLDSGGAPTLRERVRSGLDRHRAAGVHVYVAVADDSFVAGGGPVPAPPSPP
jgi:hypothetical protein